MGPTDSVEQAEQSLARRVRRAQDDRIFSEAQEAELASMRDGRL